MNTPEEHDGRLATLLRDSTSGLEPDVAELVAGGIERGRTARRRRHLGTALGGVAMGAVVAALAVAPGLGDSGSPEQGTAADQPSDKPKTKPQQPKAGGPIPDAALAVDAVDVPVVFAELLGATEAGPVLREHPYPVVNEPDRRIAHFLFDGTLTTFIIEPAAGMGTCAEQATPPATCAKVDGQDVLTWPPTEADQVTAQSVSVWVHGYIVTAMSYNAAEGKEVAPLTDAPPISLDQLTEVASNDAWFSWELAQ
jgi:hypothetical protein